MLRNVTVQRMDNVRIVFLGLELEGETRVEGRWVDRVIGLDGGRVDVAMMRTPIGNALSIDVEQVLAHRTSAMAKTRPICTKELAR